MTSTACAATQPLGAPTPSPADLTGHWRRSLLRVPGLDDDRSTPVSWVQGSCHYVDLRQPSGSRLPDERSRQVHRLEDLTGDELAILSGQQGFAGTLDLAGGVASWNRVVDLQPPASTPDAGLLRLEPRPAGGMPEAADLLIETGLHAAYVEHWWRDGEPAGETFACAGGRCEQGRAVVAVRVGEWFALARARGAELPAGAGSLRAAVTGAATLAEARMLLDCEISIGRVRACGWRIDRSSLPWREGAVLPFGVDPGWQFTAVHGDESLLRDP